MVRISYSGVFIALLVTVSVSAMEEEYRHPVEVYGNGVNIFLDLKDMLKKYETDQIDDFERKQCQQIIRQHNDLDQKLKAFVDAYSGNPPLYASLILYARAQQAQRSSQKNHMLYEARNQDIQKCFHRAKFYYDRQK